LTQTAFFQSCFRFFALHLITILFVIFLIYFNSIFARLSFVNPNLHFVFLKRFHFFTTMVKVAVIGAAGGIGQPLSLLMKQNPHISHLALYDVVNVAGVAADLSHINTKCKVTGHTKDFIKDCLIDAHMVIVPAGVPRKPGMTRDDLFKINAGIVRDIATAAAQNCPKAFMLIISNPVNSTVPIVCEVFKKHGVFDPKRLVLVIVLYSLG
jgi:malate dehydrogenase